MKRVVKLVFAIILAGSFILIAPGYYPQISDINSIVSLIQKAI